MLDRLGNTLRLTSSKGKLLFFWDPKLDMFADLTANQRQAMFNCVSKTQYIFRRGDGNLTEDIVKRVQTYFSMKSKLQFQTCIFFHQGILFHCRYSHNQRN